LLKAHNISLKAITKGNPHLVYCLLQRFNEIEKMTHYSFEDGMKGLTRRLSKHIGTSSTTSQELRDPETNENIILGDGEAVGKPTKLTSSTTSISGEQG
jgi:hypothetical protein